MKVDYLDDLASAGEPLLDLGLQPVSNRFLDSDSSDSAPRFPLKLRVDPESGLVHLARPFPVEDIQPRYDWLTCFEPEDHLDGMVDTILGLPGITKDSRFGAYSFKDDSTLRRLEHRGHTNTWRIDPALDLGVTDPRANIETFQRSFVPEVAAKIHSRYDGADVFIVRHVVEHAYNLPRFVVAVAELLRPCGYIVWELPDCEKALAQGDCTTIWEEHIFYFTGATFRNLLESFGFKIVHFDSIPYVLEDSLIAIVQKNDERREVSQSSEAVAQEVERARSFAAQIPERKRAVRERLESLRVENGPLAIFGAGHLSVAFLSVMEVADLISCVIDDDPHKKGMLMPIGQLPILDSGELYSGAIKVCLLGLNPQNQPNVLAKHTKYTESGGRFFSVFPGSSNSL